MKQKESDAFGSDAEASVAVLQGKPPHEEAWKILQDAEIVSSARLCSKRDFSRVLHATESASGSMKTTHILLKSRARLATTGIKGFLLAFVLVTPGTSQEKSSNETLEPSSQHAREPEGEEKEGRFPEIEVVASNEFRSVSYVQPLFSHLHFEGHFFNVEEARVGQLGASWEFHLGKHIALAPGLGALFGQGQTTAPSFTFRWKVEKDWFVAGGLFIQAFRKQEEVLPELEAEKGSFSTISDGNHLSVRWKGLEAGPSWERIHYREGNEWKGGGRLAFRIVQHLSAVMFVLAPQTEVRGGIILHPAR